jgi:CRISPR-associated endonuclease/helicase Cas3
VANTVQRAADIAKHLRNKGLPVKLAHSRFTQKDRAKLEKEIFNPHIRILVATQIVEVSLDISFTHLHTDCAPMDALLQRAGRVNRHLNLETGRPLLPLSPVYVYMYPHKYPYSQSSVEDSWQALLTWQESHSENILYPSDTQELIENALPPMKAQAWEDEIRMRRNRWRHTIFDLQQPLTVNPQLEQAFENLFEPTISVVPESYHQAFTNGIQQGNILQALQYSLSVPKKWLGWYKDSISQPTDQYMQYNIYQIITQGQPWVYDPSSGLLLRK